MHIDWSFWIKFKNGKVTPEERRQAFEHLADCGKCQKGLRDVFFVVERDAADSASRATIIAHRYDSVLRRK